MTEFIIGMVVGIALAIAVPMFWERSSKKQNDEHHEEPKKSSRPVYRFKDPSKGR